MTASSLSSVFPPVPLGEDGQLIYSVNVFLPPEVDAEIHRYVEEDQWSVWTVLIHSALYAYRKQVWPPERLEAEFRAMIEERTRDMGNGEGVEVTPEFWKKLKRSAERHVKVSRQLHEQGKIGNLELPEELYDFIKEHIASGTCSTPTDVVCAAMPSLRQWKAEDASRQSRRTADPPSETGSLNCIEDVADTDDDL